MDSLIGIGPIPNQADLRIYQIEFSKNKEIYVIKLKKISKYAFQKQPIKNVSDVL
jgi:hypothetical protein